VKNTSLLFGCKTKLGCGNYRNGVWRAFFFFHWFQFALTDWNGNGKESTILYRSGDGMRKRKECQVRKIDGCGLSIEAEHSSPINVHLVNVLRRQRHGKTMVLNSRTVGDLLSKRDEL